VTGHNADRVTIAQWAPSLVCSAVTALAVGLVLVSSGLVKQAAGLLVLAAFVTALWIAQKRAYIAVAPAVGLLLASLVLIGVALAVAHLLTTGITTMAVGAITVGVACAGARRPRQPAKRRRGSAQLNVSAAAGTIFFVIAAIFAVHYSAASAVTDSNQATSLSVWAYPSGDQLHVGAEQPLGHSATSLQIVVSYAGTATATWSNVNLSPGHAWRAPSLALPRSGPIRVVARHGQDVVATLSVQSSPVRATGGSRAIEKRHHARRRLDPAQHPGRQSEETSSVADPGS
jgi:hypothetical protein